MSDTASTRLSALDAMFVGIETTQLHMHLGGVLVFESGPLATEEGGIDFERITRYLEQALSSLPNYRQKLKKTPGLRHPVWVDDEHFRLRYHLRHTSLPRPGDDRHLKRLAGRIFSQSLDRHRPLWEMWIVEGLEHNRFALIVKVHHAMVDGVGGAQVLAGLLRMTPDANFKENDEPWLPHAQPSGYELFLSEYRHRRAGLAALVRRGREYLDEVKHGGGTGVKDVAGGILRIAKSGLAPAPKTTINPKEVSPHRRLDRCHYELAKIKTIKNALGGKVNDAMLALCAGALRRFLARRGDKISQLDDFRVMMPVNTQKTGGDRAGNQIAITMVDLPLHIGDVRERYQAVHKSVSEVKEESHQAESVSLLEDVADASADALLRESVRLAGAMRPYNVIITNIPGPPIPLYMLGAKLVEMVPLAPLFHHQGLGIAFFSYNGRMTIGFGADWHAVDDLYMLINDFDASFNELYALATENQDDDNGK